MPLGFFFEVFYVRSGCGPPLILPWPLQFLLDRPFLGCCCWRSEMFLSPILAISPVLSFFPSSYQVPLTDSLSLLSFCLYTSYLEKISITRQPKNYTGRFGDFFPLILSCWFWQFYVFFCRFASFLGPGCRLFFQV